MSRQRGWRTGRWILEKFLESILLLSALLSTLITIGIITVLAMETIQLFAEVSVIGFFTDTEWTPLFSDEHFGILPLFAGTCLVALIAMTVAVPFGILTATYLSEFASERFRRVAEAALGLLAGIPPVVYGYFALLSVTPFLKEILPGLSTLNALSPGIVIGVMVVPLVSALSHRSLQTVSDSLRQASFALGASRFQTTIRVVVPAALPGIISAFILAFSRAIGETMVVAIAAGQVPRLDLNPLEPVQTMAAFILQVSLGDVATGTVEFRSIFVVGGTLFFLTFSLNLLSNYLRFRGPVYRRSVS